MLLEDIFKSSVAVWFPKLSAPSPTNEELNAANEAETSVKAPSDNVPDAVMSPEKLALPCTSIILLKF